MPQPRGSCQASSIITARLGRWLGVTNREQCPSREVSGLHPSNKTRHLALRRVATRAMPRPLARRDARKVKYGRSDMVVSELCAGSMTWGSFNGSEEEAHAQRLFRGARRQLLIRRSEHLCGNTIDAARRDACSDDVHLTHWLISTRDVPSVAFLARHGDADHA